VSFVLLFVENAGKDMLYNSSKILLSIFLTLPLFAENITLNDAIQRALQKNLTKAITLQDRAIAKAKYEQALAADMPSLDMTLNINRRDEALVDETNTVFEVPMMGSLPVSYTHEVMGRDTQSAQIQLSYGLYTGGRVSAYQKQAKAAVAYAQEEEARNESEIVYNVRKYYAAVVLAQKLQTIMEETVSKMRVTYELTEQFYKGSSMRVKKTDYLRAKTTLLNMEGVLLSFTKATELAKSALCFEMGEGSECTIEVIDEEVLESIELEDSLEAYYEKLYRLNHKLKESKIALDAKDAGVTLAKSEYLPTVAIYVNAQSLHNNDHGGIINSQNNDSWNIGAVVQYNLFKGGATKAAVEEAKAQKLKLEAQSLYLRSGLELKAKKAYINVDTANKKIALLQKALETARQNSNLNLRAYQEQMVETKDVLEAQFIESLTAAALYKAAYNAALNKAELDYIIGEALP